MLLVYLKGKKIAIGGWMEWYV